MRAFKAPAGCPGVSVMGKFYETDANGIVKIPADITTDLESHGFVEDAAQVQSETENTATSLLDGKVGDITAALPSLDDAALAQLLADEQAGKNRKGVTEAIVAEQAARAAAAGAGA